MHTCASVCKRVYIQKVFDICKLKKMFFLLLRCYFLSINNLDILE